MARIWNFNAGPAALPLEVLQQAQSELLDWHGAGASIMEMSHRSAAFVALTESIDAKIRQLADISDDYAILFLQGGASQHFAQVPLNLAAPGARADYIVTGVWGKKAAAAAQPYVDARVVASTQAGHYRSLPTIPALDPDAAYLHYTANETVHGVEFANPPDCPANVPLVADMSSNIFSRPLDVNRFGLIYAGAQKNLGPSGVVLVIVRRDLLERNGQPKADVLSYAKQAEKSSMLNTPNTWGWYIIGLVIDWILAQGGLAAMQERNTAKAEQLYAAIDESGGFYRNDVAVIARSHMNIPFRLHDPALEPMFVQATEQAGMMGLKGHRSVGGIRASLYNAVPPEAVQALVSFMRDFAQKHG